MHDDAALLNKNKYQAFVIQFSDNKFRHDNAIALSFRKMVSHESDKVAELVEEVCHECFELDFQRVFSSSAQDIAASAVSKELNVEKIECGMYQGDKVGTSTVGELARSKDKVKLLIIPVICVYNVCIENILILSYYC